MQQHNDVSMLPKNLLKSLARVCIKRQPLILMVVVLLFLLSLACGGISSGRVVILTRLPTLTRTPLPTLTPTPAQVAMAATVAPAQAPGNGDEAMEKSGVIAEIAAQNAGAASGAPAELNNPQPAEVGSNTVADNSSAAGAQAPVTSGVSVAAQPSPSATPTPTATPLPSATPTEVPPTNTPTLTPTPTQTPLPEGWVFVGVRSQSDGGNLILYGDVINNTGASQELAYITATFFDGGGQQMDTGTLDYWPIEDVPAGGRVPFTLTAFGIQNAADFSLNVEAAPSEEPPTQDFEFVDASPANEGGQYCVSGRLRNLAQELNIYLSVVTVLFDAQGKVINFGDQYEHSPGLGSNQEKGFKVCADPMGQEVVDYQLRAWGL